MLRTECVPKSVVFLGIKQLYHVILGRQMVNFEVSETVFEHLYLCIARNLAAARIEPEDWDPDARAGNRRRCRL